jgi:dTDP-glucose 4,6-dehydratase
LPRVLITGGAGFIGSHLCRRFLSAGAEVLAMDNLLTGRVQNIADLFAHEAFTFIKHDVTNFIHVSGPLDAVLHLASPASPADFERLPIQILKVGALGTHKALGLAKDKGAKFLLASTSECYGDPEVNPQPETYWGNVNPIGIRGVYDEAKRFAEAMTMAYHRYHGLETRIVRIFNTYGPGMRPDDGRMIPSFFTSAIRGEDIVVYGDGSQTRSICFASDLVDGIYRLLQSSYTLPVNIGNPQELTVLDVARRIAKLAKTSARITFGPLPPDDPKVRRPDITVAQRELGWYPAVSPDEGLARTLPYFEQEVGATGPHEEARGQESATSEPMARA